MLCKEAISWHVKGMNVLDTDPKPMLIVDNEYNELLNEVEYHCTVCEAVHEDIQVLNSKIQAVYKSVTAKTKLNRNHIGTIKNWMAAYYVADDIRRAVCMKKEVHQICGIDSSTVDETHAAIKERLEFLIGTTINGCD